MPLPRFDPPGGLSDLAQPGQEQWSTIISDAVDTAIAGRTDHSNDSPRAQYYNLTKTDTADDAKFQEVSWIAFPRVVKLNSVSDRQRWQRADASRDVQDEYCEWSVTRRADGKITRVTFTCEGPEYWELLAQTQPDTVVQLYQEFVNPAVQQNDLFDSSSNYIPRNRWNSTTTDGAMHLVQSANTLSAEIELSAAASIVRVKNGQELTAEQDLVECAQYGVPQRNSDPHIGGVVNSVARLKADLALSNPVGLYFKDLVTDGWATPDGSDPKTYWTFIRGDAEHPVRAVYEVPSDKGFTVSDITILSQPINFGAQITDFISIKLTAVACRFGASTAAPMACVGPAAAMVTGIGAPSR
ncbi:MAG: hypothetical protein ACRDQ4_26995 [Pseudonocardiaceae bacterium]